jgi:membrane-bound lytic murein transglycosylase D
MVFLSRFARVFDPTWEAPQQRRPGAYGTLPLVLNESVEKNLEYFQYGIPERFQSYLDRFHHYQDLVEPVFRELGLPLELMYLSLVESGFNPRAFSRSRASGPWQFMKGTGLVYGLDVDWYLDERRDPIKSTVAAAHHLRDLYDQFGSWPLALAAYNAGSGKISRAIKKTGTRDFWTIRRSRHIRRETKEYVPRFIAATLIAQNPTAYGFSSPEGDRHEFEEVLITKRIHLSAVTQQTGIPVEELQRLNPELRRSIVPSLTGPGYYLKVPLGMASLVEEHHPKLVVWTQPPPPPTEWYQVRRGESLSVVAKRFGMKVSQLKDMNNLTSNIIRVGTKLRVRGGVSEDDADTEITWYRVRSGDSLGNIATRFRMSVNALMRLNNLSSHTIYPGDRLRVKGEPASGSSSHNDSKWYKVRQGDSLWTIAKQFRVSVNDLRALNNLSSSIIQAGRMLMVSQ